MPNGFLNYLAIFESEAIDLGCPSIYLSSHHAGETTAMCQRKQFNVGKQSCDVNLSFKFRCKSGKGRFLCRLYLKIL